MKARIGAQYAVACVIIFSPLFVFAAPPSYIPTNNTVSYPSADDIKKAQEHLKAMVADQKQLIKYRDSLIPGGNTPNSVPTAPSRVFSRAIAKYAIRITKLKATLKSFGKLSKVLVFVDAHHEWKKISDSSYNKKYIQKSIDEISQQIKEADDAILDIKKDITDVKKAFTDTSNDLTRACNDRSRNYSLEECNRAIRYARSLQNELNALEKFLKELESINKSLEDEEVSLIDSLNGVI